MFEEAKQN